MPDDASIPPVERAIALAAWVSIHMLKPVPLEEDEIAAVLGWREHLDYHDELFEPIFPTVPEDWLGPHSDAVELAEMILPSQGGARALQRYHFFETTIDPRKTDCDALLRAIASALQSRLLRGAAALPSAMAGFIVGELGVIQGTELALTFPPAEGSLAQYAEALRDDDEPYGVPEDDALRPLGWSKPWTLWANLYGPLALFGVHGDICTTIRGWKACDWSPITRSTRWHDWDKSCPKWIASPIANILRLKADPLRAILQRCLEYDRSAFHEEIDWTHAPKARQLLDTPPRELAARHARQLLLVVPPETVVAAAIELGHHPPTPAEPATSFAEQLTDALLIASQRADAYRLLDALVSKAGGKTRDQVLHYVMRQGPDAVLRGPLMTPFVATEIAQITGAPLRFHRTASWDPSEPKDNAALIDHVETMLGKQRPPGLSDRARPLPALQPMANSETLRNRLNQGRRRAEWIFKTAIEHLFRLLRSPHAPLDLLLGLDGSATRFWSNHKFGARLASHNASLKALLTTDPNPRFTLGDLLAISAATESLWQSDAALFLLAVRTGHQRLRTLCEEMKVPQLGNDGSHDTPMDRGCLAQAVDCIKAFDDAAFAVHDALPRFFVFTRLVREPNKPSVVEFAPHPDLPSSSPERVEHFVSNEAFPLDSLRGDRIYAITDVTRNTISINPVIHDWTEWLTE
jgi:hypothetical protein